MSTEYSPIHLKIHLTSSVSNFIINKAFHLQLYLPYLRDYVINIETLNVPLLLQVFPRPINPIQVYIGLVCSKNLIPECGKLFICLLAKSTSPRVVLTCLHVVKGFFLNKEKSRPLSTLVFFCVLRSLWYFELTRAKLIYVSRHNLFTLKTTFDHRKFLEKLCKNYLEFIFLLHYFHSNFAICITKVKANTVLNHFIQKCN